MKLNKLLSRLDNNNENKFKFDNQTFYAIRTKEDLNVIHLYFKNEKIFNNDLDTSKKKFNLYTQYILDTRSATCKKVAQVIGIKIFHELWSFTSPNEVLVLSQLQGEAGICKLLDKVGPMRNKRNQIYSILFEKRYAGDLLQFMNEKNDLPLYSFSRQMALALIALKQNHLVHFDVKPENILVTEKGNAVLCDFESTRDWSKNPTPPDRFTPHYFPIDFLFDEKSDVWSMGCTFYGVYKNELCNWQELTHLLHTLKKLESQFGDALENDSGDAVYFYRDQLIEFHQQINQHDLKNLGSLQNEVEGLDQFLMDVQDALDCAENCYWKLFNEGDRIDREVPVNKECHEQIGKISAALEALIHQAIKTRAAEVIDPAIDPFLYIIHRMLDPDPKTRITPEALLEEIEKRLKL